MNFINAGALIVFRADPEFRGGIFGQIVGQALTVQPHPETALQDKPAVLGDGFQMLPCLHERTS